MSVYPMCVRASYGLLSLRKGVQRLNPSVNELFRVLSTDTSKPPDSQSSPGGGVTQAILQERLQQQQRAQVSSLSKLAFYSNLHFHSFTEACCFISRTNRLCGGHLRVRLSTLNCGFWLFYVVSSSMVLAE